MMVSPEEMNSGGRQMKALTKILCGVALAGLAVACSQELDFSFERPQPVVTITASVDDAAATKAFLDEDLKIEWNEGDALSLLSNGVNAKFTAREEGLRTSFDHSGEITEQAYYALYPYNATAGFSGGTITTTLPTVQTAADASFGRDANLAVAYAEWGKNFYFRNAVGYAKVSFKTQDESARITKVTVRSLKEDVLLSGKVTLTPTVEGGEVSDVAVTVTDGVPYATVAAASGTVLTPETDYYIVVAPGSLSAGYRVEFETEEGVVFSKDYDGEEYRQATFRRNSIASVGKKDLDKYVTAFEAYWRISEAEDFTSGSYLFAYDLGSGIYRLFNEAKTDAWTGGGAAMMQKFYDKDFPSDSMQMLFGGWLTSLNNMNTAWKNGNTPAWMSHFVLYTFRNAFLDSGTATLPYASDQLIVNPTDACVVSVDENKNISFSLYYKDKNSSSETYNQTLSTDVELKNCAAVFKGTSAQLTGSISEASIDGLVNIIFNGKGSSWNSAMTPDEIKQTAVKACNEVTTIGYCAEAQTTADGTVLNNLFMINNKYLCTVPKDPAYFGLYKKSVSDLSYAEYATINK